MSCYGNIYNECIDTTIPTIPTMRVSTTNEIIEVMTAGVPLPIPGTSVLCLVSGVYNFTHTSYFSCPASPSNNTFYLTINNVQVLESVRVISCSNATRPNIVATNCLISLSAGDVVSTFCISSTNSNKTFGYRTSIGIRVG